MMISSLKIKKILSMLVVIFLISTVFAQAVSSKGLFSDIREKTKETIDKVKDNIKEKTREKVNDIREKISPKRTEKTDNRGFSILDKIKTSPLISTLFSYSAFKTESSLFVIYAKYGESEKETPTRLGIPTLIDIDDDGKNDVKAKIVLRLGIEKPFALSLNFKLRVDRLKGISDVNEHLEIYAQLSFPALLDSSLKGDKARFGFLSEKYEDIPDFCEVTYKYVPYIFSKEKPLHKTVMDPGDIQGNDDINILFSYVNDAGENLTIDTFKVKLEPAVRTEMTVTGFEGSIGRSFEIDTSSSSTAVVKYSRFANDSTFEAGVILYKLSSFKFDIELTPFKKGGGRVEYQRDSDEPVEALLFFESKNKSNYFFAEDIPKHIKISWNTAQNNLIKVDTFGERCSAVGWRNALLDEDVTAKAYLSNLPSYIELNWIGKLSEGEIELTTDISGCSAHIYATELKNDGYLTADISSGENFDFSVYWSFSRQVFGISRSNIDLSVDVSFHNLLGKGESANLSFDIENKITSPFEFCFDEFLDFDAKVEFTGNDFAIKNVDIDLNIPSIGKFILKMNSFEMTRQSSVYFAFSVDESNEGIDVSCNIHVSNGVVIKGLIIGFNDFLYPVDDIVVDGEYDHTISLSITPGFVKFHFNKDGSGYIVISGGLNLFVNSDYYNNHGILMAHVEGTVSFLTEDDTLNISWESGGGLSIDGSGVVSLTGFSLWVKDKVEVSIPAIVGRFTLNAEDNTGSLNLVLSKSTITLVTDFSIKIKNFEGITVKADFSIDGSLSLSGNLKISWGPSGVQIKTVGVSAGVNGDFTVSDLYFKFGNTMTISADKIKLSGKLSLDVSLLVSSGGMGVKLNSYGMSLLVKNFDIDSSIITVSFNEFYLGGHGFINLGSSSDIKLLTADVDGRVRILGLYIGSNSLGIPSPLSLSFATDLSGAGQLMYTASTSDLMVSIWGTKPVIIDNFYFNLNHGQILAMWDKLHIKVNAYAEIKLSSKEIYATASVNYLIFENCELLFQSQKMIIDGKLTCTYSGELNIRVDTRSGSPNPDVEIDLSDGVVDITDFYLKYTSGGKYIELEWSSMSIAASLNLQLELFSKKIVIDAVGNGNVDIESLGIDGTGDISAFISSIYIEGDLILNIEYNTGFKEFDIEVSGSGLVEVDTGSVTVPEMVDVSLGYFKLDLDDVKSSIIGLSIGDSFNIESASASGSITEIDIQNFYCSIHELAFENIPIVVDITSLQVSFTGSGDFEASLSEPQEGVKEVSLEGSLEMDGRLDIDYANVFLIMVGFELDTFSISGPTTFHLNAQGNTESDASDSEKISQFSLVAGCDSTWIAKHLNIAGMVILTDFSGKGDISLGAEINGAVDPEAPSDDYFVVGLDGDWGWSNLGIMSKVNLGIGAFSGKLNVKVDLAFFMDLFDLSFEDPFCNLATEADIIINVDKTSTLDFSLTSNLGLDHLLYFGPTTVNQGIYTISYSWTLATKKQGDKWPPIGGEGFHYPESGTLYIDTDKKTVDWSLSLLNSRIEMGGSAWFDDWTMKWGKNETGGLIPLEFGGDSKLFDDFYLVICGISLIGEYEPSLDVTLIPVSPYTSGQKFSVKVTDFGEYISGATVTYDKKIGADWLEVDTNITNSGGVASFIAESGDYNTYSRVVVSHPDYPKSETINFYVEPGDDGLTADAAGPYSGAPGVDIQFNGYASGGITPYTYQWDFGDDSTSNEQNPIHDYQNEGTYTVTLTVTDNSGETATDTTEASIDTNNEPPYFDIPSITGPSKGESEQLLDFTAHATDPDGDPLQYKWKKSTPSGVPLTTGWFNSDSWSCMWTVLFPPKEHWVMVKVKDNHGLSTGWSPKFYVTITKDNNEPNAVITSPQQGYVGLVGEEITFDGSDSYDSDGDIVSYEWDFGDGDTDTGAITTHAYPHAFHPAYVELTVTDDYGATSYTTVSIYIQYPPGAPPVPDAGGPYYEDSIKPIEFDGSDSYDPDGYIVSYEWDFGDGNTGTGEIVEHTYSSAGTYTVILTVEDNDGWIKTDTTTAEFDVTGSPPNKPSKPSCSGSTFNVGEEVDFSTSATDPDPNENLKYMFDWGDGTSTGWVGRIPPYDSGDIHTDSHTWSTPGTYDVKVRAKDKYGNIGPWSDCKVVNIV